MRVADELVCPGCGVAVQAVQSSCVVCGRALSFTAFSDTRGASFRAVKESLNAVSDHRKQTEGESADVALTRGFALFDSGMFSEAREAFNQMITCGTGAAEAYFYRALSDLRSQRPSQVNRERAKGMIADLDMAFRLDQRPQYLWAKAWVIEIAFERRYLNYPERSADLRAQAETDLSSDDLRDLCQMLAVK